MKLKSYIDNYDKMTNGFLNSVLKEVKHDFSCTYVGAISGWGTLFDLLLQLYQHCKSVINYLHTYIHIYIYKH